MPDAEFPVEHPFMGRPVVLEVRAVDVDPEVVTPDPSRARQGLVVLQLLRRIERLEQLASVPAPGGAASRPTGEQVQESAKPEPDRVAQIILRLQAVVDNINRKVAFYSPDAYAENQEAEGIDVPAIPTFWRNAISLSLGEFEEEGARLQSIINEVN